MPDTSGGNYNNSIRGGYPVASMLALLVADPKDETNSHYLLSDRDRFHVVVPRYHGDLSTAFNYTCLLVAFRDAVVGES